MMNNIETFKEALDDLKNVDYCPASCDGSISEGYDCEEASDYLTKHHETIRTALTNTQGTPIEDERCPDCGAGDDNHHSYTCKLGLHPDKKAQPVSSSMPEKLKEPEAFDYSNWAVAARNRNQAIDECTPIIQAKDAENGKLRRHLEEKLHRAEGENIKLREALESLLSQYDPEDANIHVDPHPSCIMCTSGATPDNLNTGFCALHKAQQALKGGA